MTEQRMQADTNSGPSATTETSGSSATAVAPNPADAAPAEAAAAPADDASSDDEGSAAAPAEPVESDEEAEERSLREEAAREEATATPEEKKRRAVEARFMGAIGFQRATEGLKQSCTSALGRQTLARMKLLEDAEAIRTCLEQTREALSHELRLPIADCHDVKAIIGRVKEPERPLHGGELRKIYATLAAAREVKRFLDAMDADKAPRLRALANHLDACEPVSNAINVAIDLRGDWRSQASPRMAEIHNRMNTLRGQIEKALLELAQKPEVAIALHNPRPVVRNDRLVLAVKAQKKNEVPGTSLGKGRGGSILFIEPEAVKPLVAEMVALVAEEKAEAQRVQWDLTRVVVAHQAILERTANTLGWIDFTQAKAMFAHERGFSIPQVSTDGVLELKDAVHPLMVQARHRKGGDEAKETVVPFTLTLGRDADIIVITGPKQGGKTVVLRTLGLCVALAQCGLPIPASAESKLPVFKTLIADISEGRTGPAGRSAYATHLGRIRELLAEVNKDSLVLLDDVGLGTDPIEGAALGQAVLEKLAAAGAKVVITTHLTALKGYANQNPRALNASMAFDGEKDSPTYRFFTGYPGVSATFSLARKSDVPADVIARATELLQGQDRRLEGLLTSLQTAESVARDAQDKAQKLEKAVLAEKQTLEAERHSIERKKQALAMEADLEMEERFLLLQRAVKETGEALKKSSDPVAVEGMAKLAAKVEELLKHTPFEQKRRDFATKLKKGEYVYVVSLGLSGEIVKVERDKGKIKVACGAITMDTTFDNVSWLEGRVAKPDRPAPRAASAEDEADPTGKNDEFGFRKGQRPTNYQGGFGGPGGGGGGRGGPGGGGRGRGGMGGGGRGGPGMGGRGGAGMGGGRGPGMGAGRGGAGGGGRGGPGMGGGRGGMGGGGGRGGPGRG